jgi:hypothetical protein
LHPRAENFQLFFFHLLQFVSVSLSRRKTDGCCTNYIKLKVTNFKGLQRYHKPPRVGATVQHSIKFFPLSANLFF